MNRSLDWLSQATHDLGQAEESRAAGRHEWACFAAQQSAEKAANALNLSLGQESWGHVVARLLLDVPAVGAVPADLIEKAKVLDNLYIPSRYPDSHPEGAPFEHYGPLQSTEALRYAGEILEFVRLALAQS